MYAKVQGGVVVRYFNSLPENYENTSGFKFLDDLELAARGILPVEEIRPDKQSVYQDYGDPAVDVQPLKVVLTYPLVNPSLADLKAIRRQEFREQLKDRLYRDTDMETYVAMLVLDVVPAGIKTTVGQIKTAYDDAITALNNATTLAQVIAVTPAWPA